MTGDPGGADWPDDLDVDILTGLRELYDELDPVEEGLDEVVILALATRDLDAELAQIVEDQREYTAVRSGGRVRTLRFEAEGVHLLLTIAELPAGERRVDGWVAPSEEATVELRASAADARGVNVDDDGRFVLAAVPSGAVRFVVRTTSGAVATPVIQL